MIRPFDVMKVRMRVLRAGTVIELATTWSGGGN